MSRSHLPVMLKIALLAGTSLIPVSAAAQEAPAAAEEPVETVTVLGSRIPRIRKEGPAPITTVTAQTIAAEGYTTIPDVLKSLTQNGGQTQSQQSYGGALTTPGAAQVDLRGLGPNHTLVMINGRRVADFPMPYQGLSNFTDVSNIPLGMIEKVEVLSGSASAIYGSDAIAGVVNFTLKKKVDKTTVDLRLGTTEHGGGDDKTLTLSTGFSKNRFNLVFGMQLSDRDPVWGFDREIQDSREDAPTARSRFPFKVAQRYDVEAYYATEDGTDCSKMTGLAGGTVVKTVDRFDDYYCASPTAVSYGTITSGRQSGSTFTSATYEIDDKTTLFADLQLSVTDTQVMNDVTYWRYQDAEGTAVDFYNEYSGEWENWSRVFMPEEMGGLEKGMIHNHSTSGALTAGIRGAFGQQWTYEAAVNYSTYRSRIKIPQIVAAKANAFYLGEALDDDTFDADPAKLFTPLTPAQYGSISENARTKAEATVKGLSLSFNHPALFELPAGPVGFAAIAEFDEQSYSVQPNANATNFGYYYQYAATSGAGKRDHKAIGAELSLPLLSNLQASVAARYDTFGFADRDIGKTTYNIGLEYRPMNSLLLRAAYGTGFRAPDLHYLYANLDLFHPTVIDYYQCRTDPTEIGLPYDECYYSEEEILKHREGDTNLKPETSKSYNVGFVWQPSRHFDISIDYFNIDMSNQIQDLSLKKLLTDEADCRIGQTDTGQTVNPTSPTCLDALSRVNRDSGGTITYVYINPINQANEKTDGIDLNFHAALPETKAGKFSLSGGYTYVLKHTSIQFEGDDSIDQLKVDSGYYIPRDKANLSLTWALNPVSVTLTGNRTGKLPNYDEDARVKAYTIYNATATWDIKTNLKATLTLNNLLDRKPVRDMGWTSYPYYNSDWYDSIGRAGYINLSYSF
ncbi:TonB-dependent siderophore receptor [Asticcacaulis sp. AND118]|uniref:TonB-dependent receptor plug domain-containing protein n=1 Tax=Asticcacaulis sp. AND118 TaxID=2840468 RepID=UPI001CFF8AAF|nr:TonB-dependent receptor [Asticcacaulis sp. AND118]UDF05443.1 TonB-dependent receptor [Asticcacaulis sp. AND118]